MNFNGKAVTQLHLTKIKILNKCRACLLNDGKRLFSAEHGKDRINIREIFEAHTGIKLNEDENLPRSLCNDCFNGLVSTHKFITKCKSTDTILCSLKNVLTRKTPTGYEDVLTEVYNTAKAAQNSKAEQSSEVIENETSKITDGETKGTSLNLDNSTVMVISNISIQDEDKFNGDEATNSITNTLNKNDSGGLRNTTGKNKHHNTKTNQFVNKLVNTYKSKLFKKSLVKHKSKLSMLDTETRAVINKVVTSKRAYKTFENRVCNVCFKTFDRASTMREHINTHTKEKPYRCEMCPSSFSAQCNLRRHSRIHTGEKPYICDMCGKGFIQSTSLKKHIETHASEKYLQEVKELPCSYCNSVFDTNQKFMQHLVEMHRDADLKDEDQQLLSHFCEVCKRYFYSTHSLKLHKQIHTDVKNYLCSYCGKGFYTKTGLNVHVAIHTGERPFSCSFCGKTFTKSSSCKSHTYIHTGVKPYQCKMCNKAFQQSQQLRYHLLSHTGEKPHSCRDCGKKFTLKANLKRHLLVHTSKISYCCSYCGTDFNNVSNLNEHLLVHCESDKRM